MPCQLSVPLYIIAFVGFIVDYNENNKKIIEFKVIDCQITIQKDILKIILLSIVSLFLIIEIPSIANAGILGLSYLVIGTIKIIKTNRERAKKLALIYGAIAVITFILALYIISSSGSFRFNRIISSFNPEIDPKGSGYTGMLQKEILENAKLIGEADTRVISSDEYIIIRESNFTFIYLVGKTGILISSLLVLTIILTSIKLIYSAKNIKDIYGKFIIIGLSCLFIIQSITSVLMNINMGIKLDVNIPFVAYGGFYLFINIINMALILSVYRRKDINLDIEEKNTLNEVN